MMVKMTQNLENKMEFQIYSLETRIEKIQERFNKDLEEIKKCQYIMNNAINGGNPLQYSCLGSPIDRGAWRAAIHGVTKESDII